MKSILNPLQSTDRNPVQYVIFVIAVLHNVFDIFMIMYFGNEIKVSSSLLSYYLFESTWMGQSNSNKKSLLILMEVLRKPQKLLIGKVFALDLETFTSVKFVFDFQPDFCTFYMLI